MLTIWLNQLTHQATLAANGWGDLIVVGIIFTLIIGGSVANGLRKLGEKLKAGQRNQFNNSNTGGQAGAREMAQHTPRGQQTARQRMGSASAERQTQLEKLREFRAQQQGSRASSTPSNLTSAQRAARDRARQAYERRAELLARQQQAKEQAARQQTTSQRTRQTSPQTGDRSSSSGPSSHRQAAAPQQAQRPQSSAQRPQAQRAQPSPPRPRIHRTPNATAVGSIGSTVSNTLKEMAGSSNPVHVERLGGRAIISEDSLQVHYHESHHAEKAAKVRQKLLAGSSLRAAMILKEVLEKPNALRDPQDLPGEVVW